MINPLFRHWKVKPGVVKIISSLENLIEHVEKEKANFARLSTISREIEDSHAGADFNS